jgi:AcrR family transcriptional regulator
MTRTAQDHVREATQMFGDGDERVLFAAAQLFREEVSAGTTVREIAAAAKMLPGSLHYRFPSKDVILVELIKQGVKRAITTELVRHFGFGCINWVAIWYRPGGTAPRRRWPIPCGASSRTADP